MATRLLVWVAERCAEWLLVALLLLVYGSLVFGDSRVDGPLLAEFLNFEGLYIALLAVLMFYIMSGYLFSTVYFGIWGRRQRPLRQAGVMMSVFFGHYGFLMALFTGPGNLLIWPMGVLGACIVAMTTLAGGIFLRKVEGEPDLFQTIIQK